MLVAVLHNAVAADAPPDERDVLEQVAAVTAALRSLGHEPVGMPVTLDLETTLRGPLAALRPAVAFNLVESLGATDRLSAAVPMLLDVLGVPCTGNDADALHLTNSKRLTKLRLAESGLPTPAAVRLVRDGPRLEGGSDAEAFPACFLMKAVHEHASFGMDDAAVIDAASLDDVADALRLRIDRYGRPFFAERFIDGREFNLSLLADGDETTVLPAAEIRFDAFPPGKPRIVGYAAKWTADSFEYNRTPRRFDFPSSDEAMLGELRSLAVQAWLAFDLSGYARVDFRIDGDGRPWIIEANANPCLSPDAGFAAALAVAGFDAAAAAQRILDAAR